MRVALAIAVGLACPSLAGAQAAGDRYGPPSTTLATAVAGEAWRGPTLGWANKSAAAPTQQSALPAAPSPYREARVYAPFRPQVPLPLQRSQPQPVAAPPPVQTRPLPTSLYSPAQPAPVRAPVAAVQPAAAPAPQRMAAVTPRPNGGAPRFYSVHRGYGLEPDAIPEPPAGSRYVLIGPPDAPAEKPDAREDDNAGDRSDAF
jgi:hypothetical protein